MYATVRYIDFQKYRRIIVISDIHADRDGFLGVWDKVKFERKDALVIVGDILERGSCSLELLHMVMDMTKQGNLYMVAGNNDTLFLEWMSDLLSEKDVMWYVTHRRHSIIMDMAEKLNLPYGNPEEIQILRDRIQGAFKEEIAFLNGLPHIIDSNIATFVHAGLQPGPLEKQDPDYCLRALEFASQPYVFAKKVIVGHWPSSNYSTDIINNNIYRNSHTNVISIDGGNSMKSWQQINYLILAPGGNELESGYYDTLPKIEVLEDQEESREHFTLLFPNTLLEIREAGEEKSVCYVPWLDKELLIENQRIYEYKEQTYCGDVTTYRLPVKAGEILSLCTESEKGILVKKNGIVGNYYGQYRKSM